MNTATTEKRKRLKREERQAQILEVGLRVFARKGFAATTLDEVAAEAGITKPIIYDYFENKEAFFDAIAENEMTLITRRVMNAIDTTSDEPIVEQTLGVFFQYLQERPDGFRALTSHAPMSWYGNDRRSELRRAFYAARVEDARRILKAVGDHETDPGVLAHSIIGSLTFIGEYWLNTDGIPVEQIKKSLANLMRFGLPTAGPRSQP